MLPGARFPTLLTGQGEGESKLLEERHHSQPFPPPRLIASGVSDSASSIRVPRGRSGVYSTEVRRRKPG